MRATLCWPALLRGRSRMRRDLQQEHERRWGPGGAPTVNDAASDSPRDAATLDLGGLIDAACDGPAETCRPNPCGNGMLNPPAETCDDGNHTGGDGCSPDCKAETDWICPTPGSRVHLPRGLRRWHDRRRGELRRSQHESGRWLRWKLSARTRLDVSPDGGALRPSLRRRNAAWLRAVRRRQRVARRRLQRQLPGGAGLRLPDTAPGLPPHDVRRPPEGRQ